MSNEEFFQALLTKTEIAFQKSTLVNSKWFYSICATPVHLNEGLIIGINWGGGSESDDTKYQRQIQLPTGSDIGSYSFIKRVLPYLDKYLKTKDLFKINYSNICFFRTPDISRLTEIDLQLSWPLFEEYVSFTNPKWILMLSNNIKYFRAIENLEAYYVEHKNKRFSAFKGKVLNTTFYALPHPNSKLKNVVRTELWNKVFK